MFRIYNSFIPILFSLRFITLIFHLIMLILLLLDRKSSTFPDNNFTKYDSEYIIWLSVSIGILGLELISYLFSISSMVIYQSFISILIHSIGIFVIFGFYTEAWIFSDIRWVLGFCTAIPFLTEFLAYFDVFILKKTYV